MSRLSASLYCLRLLRAGRRRLAESCNGKSYGVGTDLWAGSTAEYGMNENTKESKYLSQTQECANCGGREKIVLEEEVVAPGDKVYPDGTVLCAKCRTPTMVTVYRWKKWEESG